MCFKINAIQIQHPSCFSLPNPSSEYIKLIISDHFKYLYNSIQKKNRKTNKWKPIYYNKRDNLNLPLKKRRVPVFTFHWFHLRYFWLQAHIFLPFSFSLQKYFTFSLNIITIIIIICRSRRRNINCLLASKNFLLLLYDMILHITHDVCLMLHHIHVRGRENT